MNVSAVVVHNRDDEERIPKDQYISSLRQANIDSIYFYSSFDQLLNDRNQIEPTDILLLNNAPNVIFDFNYFLSHCKNECTCLLTYCRNFGEDLYYIDNGELVKKQKTPISQHDAYQNASIYYIPQTQFQQLSGEAELVPTTGIPCPQSKNAPLTPALFLDRDGVLIEDGKYLFHPKDTKIYPEAVEIIKEANRRKWYVFILTNQSGVARGYFNENDIVQLHNYLDGELQNQGAYINHWHYCPFFENASGEYGRNSLLRKPNPGMLLNACHTLPIDLNSSFMIGDKKSDIISQPGVRTLLIQRSYDTEGADVPLFFDLEALADFLFK